MLTNTTLTPTTINLSGGDFSFTCMYRKGNRIQTATLTNSFKRGQALAIPAGTTWQVCAFSAKPDVYLVALHLPEHEAAGTNGLVGVMLRDASYRKLLASQAEPPVVPEPEIVTEPEATEPEQVEETPEA